MTSAAPPRPADRPATLVIHSRVEAGRALLTPRGRLVQGCAEILAEALAALPAGIEQLELDMAGVEFMDPAGLRFLDLLGGYGHRQGVPATTANWHGQPLRALEQAGLDTADPLRTTTAHELREEVEQLRHAMASRPVIDQARGVLMAVHACTSDEAWHILREASQLSNTKLHTVAAAITASAGNGPPPPPELRTALRTALSRRGH